MQYLWTVPSFWWLKLEDSNTRAARHTLYVYQKDRIPIKTVSSSGSFALWSGYTLGLRPTKACKIESICFQGKPSKLVYDEWWRIPRSKNAAPCRTATSNFGHTIVMQISLTIFAESSLLFEEICKHETVYFGRSFGSSPRRATFRTISHDEPPALVNDFWRLSNVDSRIRNRNLQFELSIQLGTTTEYTLSILWAF